jgi:putative sterol carrier protein
MTADMQVAKDPIVVTYGPGPTAEDFFHGIAPKLLNVRKRAVVKLGGRFGFRLSGEGGGAWTVSFDEARVLEGAEAADVVVGMPGEDFIKLLKGSLDIEQAMDEGRIQLEGDVEKLSVLAAVFRPA